MPTSLELPRPPVVLIASGQEWSARSLESVLSPRGYEVRKAYSAAQINERIGETRPDLLIIEDTLPDVGAVNACESLRADPQVGVDTPILVATTHRMAGRERLAALSAGAWDVLSMPMDAEELVIRLHTYALAKLQGDQAKEHSLTDLETGFYNLWGLVRRLAELTATAHRYARPIGCLIVEVAHQAERTAVDFSQMIAQIAHDIRRIIRVPDIPGRLSPTALAIIAPDTDPTGTRTLAERVYGVFSDDSSSSRSTMIRIGGYATEDFFAARIEGAEILARATKALQLTQVSGKSIEFFDASDYPPPL